MLKTPIGIVFLIASARWGHPEPLAPNINLAFADVQSYGAGLPATPASPAATEANRAREASFPRLKQRAEGQTFSSLDAPTGAEPKEIGVHALSLEGAELDSVLGFYQQLSGRTVVRSLNLAPVRISLHNENALSRREALQTLDTALAGCGIAMIVSGTNMVKAVPANQASTEAGPIIDWAPDRLPDSGTYIVYIVRMKENQLPHHVAPALQPFAKMPNSILAIDNANTLILRDYSSNVRQMLQVLERFGTSSFEDNERGFPPGQPRDGIPRGPTRPR
jgi:type II secretory pathway component GspD/PulD (secretin)